MSDWRPRVGDRVEYSIRGLNALNPRHGQRRGTVVGKSHGAESVSVVWDGRRHRQSFWLPFLAQSEPGHLEPSISPVHQRMIDLCREGKTTKEIADAVGRCVEAVWPVLRRAGLSAAKRKLPAPSNPQSWPEARCAALAKLWNAGYTSAEIAQRIGVTRNAVIGKAHRLNLPPRQSPIRRAA